MKSPVRFMARGLAEEVRDENPRNHPRHCERSEAIQLWGCEIESWIASSRSLSSGARSRDPLAVCPAWALTRRWKSSRELVTASEANRRASDREAGVKEAGSEAAGRRTGTGKKAGPSKAGGQ